MSLDQAHNDRKGPFVVPVRLRVVPQGVFYPALLIRQLSPEIEYEREFWRRWRELAVNRFRAIEAAGFVMRDRLV
jgi:hypothetical protein